MTLCAHLWIELLVNPSPLLRPILQCKLGWCWNAIAYLIGFQASPVYIAQRGVKWSQEW